jgi:hypothetical protein
MKKLRNKFIKNLRYIFLIGVSALGLMAIIGTGGGSGGDGDGDGDGDSCAGPVPCLTVNFGNTAYIFEDQLGNLVAVLSDGAIVGVGFFWDDGQKFIPIGLAGSVTDCRNGELTEGAKDLNGDFIPDPGEEFASVSGNVNICNRTLTVSNLVLDGIPQQDIVATFFVEFPLSLSGALQIDREPPIKFLQKVMERMSVE